MSGATKRQPWNTCPESYLNVASGLVWRLASERIEALGRIAFARKRAHLYVGLPGSLKFSGLKTAVLAKLAIRSVCAFVTYCYFFT